MMQNIKEAEAYLNEIPKFIKKNTMEDTRAFYEKLGRPGSESRVIHVAGTNGKGSVCAYLDSVLRMAGYTVGMFISPHLEDIRERIRVNGERIAEADFVRIFDRVKEGGYRPSYFEFLYFMAMLYFEEKKPDFILLETGLGGRLDATNSYPAPIISIITEIGMDHMAYLGGTIEEIAGEKAGIVRKDVPLVYLAKNKSVSDIMENRAENVGTKAFPVLPSEILLCKWGQKGIDFSYDSGYYKCNMFFLSTTALYQQENAALCIKALALLQKEGKVQVTDELLYAGLKNARWEGRMEEIWPRVFLDGAHNRDGINAFLETVRAHTGRKLLLFSALADKSYEEMINAILQAGIFEEIMLAPVKNERAADLKKMELQFLKGKEKFGYTKERIWIFHTAEEALECCLEKQGEDGLVFVTGSLYLVGEIRSALKGVLRHD